MANFRQGQFKMPASRQQRLESIMFLRAMRVRRGGGSQWQLCGSFRAPNQRKMNQGERLGCFEKSSRIRQFDS
jgi:hypothetical protein